MKRIIWIIFGTILFLSGISHIEAKTLVTPSGSQGNVAINLTFEEGYVGGIDLTFKVNGAVSLSSVNWSSVVASNYTKRYSYDESTGTLRLIVTTGNQKNNLIDKKGNVGLGTLSFKSKSGNKVSYTMNAVSLTIVDATYRSIAKKDLETKSNQFTIEGSSSSGGNTGGNTSGNTGGNTNVNQNPSNNQVNANTSSNKGTSGNKGTSNNKGSNNNGSSSVNQDDSSGEVDADDKEDSGNLDSIEKEEDNKTSSNIKKPDVNKKDETTGVSKEDTKKKGFPFRMVGFGLIVLALLLLVIKKIRR